MNGRRVVITGMGLFSPLGLTIDANWQRILRGESGIDVIDTFDVEKYGTKFGGLVRQFDILKYLPKKDAKKFDLFIQYGLGAALEAIDNAKLDIGRTNLLRVGAAIGSGIGGLDTIEKNVSALINHGPRRVSPFFVPGSIVNMIAGQLSIMTGIKGPNLSIVTACTSGVHNIGVAARAIAYGDADVMIAGGAEAAATPLGLAGFSAARALSTRNDSPKTASRPWDKNRDGFVLSDGAGMVVIESLDHAEKRGANILGEIVGFGMSADAHHMTSPPEDGSGAALAMQNAINDANINLADIGYINAHGTSTPAGDIAEVRAAKATFGEDVHNLVMSSTKSMTGHLLGAAGAAETIYTALALKDQIAPPTINLDNPDDGCDLNFAANKAVKIVTNYALCNSFGFGGTNGSLLLKKV